MKRSLSRLVSALAAPVLLPALPLQSEETPAPHQASTAIPHPTTAGSVAVPGVDSPQVFTIKVTPPDPSTGSTDAVIKIAGDGTKVERTLNVGNARWITVDDGRGNHTFTTNTHDSKNAPAQGPVTWLGVGADEAPDEVRAQLPLTPGTGLLVRAVVPDSPAAKAGVLKHDVLARLEDQLLVNGAQFKALVSGRKAGERVKLTLYRQGKEVVVEVTLATHAVEDDTWSVTTFMAHPGIPQAVVHPLVMQSRALIVDPKGNVITAQGSGAVPDPTKLEEALKAAGVGDEVRRSVEKSLAEVRQQLEEQKNQLEKNKNESLQRLEDSAADLAKALESARAAAKEARKRAVEAAAQSAPAPSKAGEEPSR